MALDKPIQRARPYVETYQAPPRLALARSGAVEIRALPATVNLYLYQGDSFTLRLDVTDPSGDPLDLTGAVAASQIRTSPESYEIAGQFQPVIDGSAIFLHLLPNVSAQLPAKTVWDVDITRSGEVTTLAAGSIDLTPEVTRP